MLRIRLQLPKGAAQTYDHRDLLHDACINALTSAGAVAEDLIGHQAKPWTFAPLGWHRRHHGLVHSLVIATPNQMLARSLSRLEPQHVVKRRWDGDSINFSQAQLRLEPDPILPGQQQLACVLLSPLLLQDHTSEGKGKRWHSDLNTLHETLGSTLSRKLSFIAERDVDLQVYPDSLYLRANPKHSVLVNLKAFKDGSKSYVIGMQAPLLLQGSEEDLRLAWYAGIGEKTRSGFGCLGLAEEGVGR